MENLVDKEQVVTLRKCRSGLGMKICGGLSEEGKFTGIFVKKILSGGAVGDEGTLEEGDQLLSANGESLLKCSNDQAVAILRKAAQTGTTKITFTRSSESRQRFERLFPDANQSFYSSMNQQMSFRNNDSLSRSDSMSSRISTTSLEKRAWIYNGDRMSPAPLREPLNQSMPSFVNNHELHRMEAVDFPLSRGNSNQETSRRIHPNMTDPTIKDLLSTFERTASLDSGLPLSSRFSSPDNSERGNGEANLLMTIEIPAKTNLGISICGGKNKPEGPHIYVKEIIQGCDAYMDGRLRRGDRIISINGESTEDVTYEQARSMLMRLKLRRDLMKYTVVYAVNSSSVPRIQNSSTRTLDNGLGTSNHQLSVAAGNESQLPSGQSPVHEASLHRAESFISQSSDDEALLKELMKMVENGDDNEKTLDGINSLELPHAPIKTNGDSTNTHLETTVCDTRDYQIIQEISPTHLEPSRFTPGLVSSPEERDLDQILSASPQNQSISHYLEQDINRLYPAEEPSRATSRSTSYSRKNRDRRLSLDPSTRIRVEKLEAALNYLGFQASPSKIQALHKRVRVDPNGTVTYGDFVDAARHVLDLRMDDRSRTLNATTLQFAMKDIEALERAEIQKTQQRETERRAELQAMERRNQEDIAQISRERDDALRELYYLRQRFNEKKQNDPAIEDELNRSRQEVANAYREVGELRTRTHLVSTALQEARQKEQQFEKKIGDLEEEVQNQSSRKATGGPKQQEFNELQKRLVVLGCQLRKSEVSKRTYEVAVEKLTKFVEHVHDTFIAEEDKVSTPGSRRSSKVNRSSRGPVDIAQEARETVKSVKLLLEEEPLPFGWEEVYSPDGSRYYINHVTQTTSWLHPVSGIQHLSSKEDRQPPPLDQKF